VYVLFSSTVSAKRRAQLLLGMDVLALVEQKPPVAKVKILHLCKIK
jgi:hypothetical protein